MHSFVVSVKIIIDKINCKHAVFQNSLFPLSFWKNQCLRAQWMLLDCRVEENRFMCGKWACALEFL